MRKLINWLWAKPSKPAQTVTPKIKRQGGFIDFETGRIVNLDRQGREYFVEDGTYVN